MARNLGRKFAAMTEEERRNFALEEDEGTRELPTELVFDEPRDPEHMGSHFPNPREEFADPEHRDGMSAQLDDEQHERAVQEWATRRKCVAEGSAKKANPDHPSHLTPRGQAHGIDP